MVSRPGPSAFYPFAHYCLRCETWFKSRSEIPDRCAKCGSFDYDKPRIGTGHRRLKTEGYV